MLLPPQIPVGLWPSAFAVAGPGSQTERHQHHGIHLLLARQGVLRATVGDDTRTIAGLVTPPDCPHHVDATGASMVMVFVDPQADVGCRIAQSLGGAPRWIEAEERDVLLSSLPEDPRCEALTAWLPTALSRLDADAIASLRAHPKVKRVLALLADEPLDPAPSLEDFASRLSMSASRLGHVFAESTGTSWRAYLRWLRLQRSAAAIVCGSTLATAAQEGGFHDSAHMTRTFKAMYGIVPSKLRGDQGPSSR